MIVSAFGSYSVVNWRKKNFLSSYSDDGTVVDFDFFFSSFLYIVSLPTGVSTSEQETEEGEIIK